MKSRRRLRVEERIKRVLGELLHSGTRDPRVGFVSVMGVEMTADLKQADVYVSIFGDEPAGKKALEGLSSAQGWLQRELGAELGCRYTPILKFHLDRSITQRARISGILEELKEKGEWTADEPEDED